MLKFLGDGLALLSVVVLAIPAWYANRYGRLVAQLNLKNLRLGEPEFQTEYDELVKRMKELRDDWKPWKGWCFWIGTLTAIVAAAIVIYTGLNERAPPGVHT